MISMKPKRNGLFLKLVVVAVVVYLGTTLVSLQIQAEQQAERRDQVQLEIERQKRENALLEEALDQSGTDEFVSNVARESLGYVSADEKIFVDISN